MADRSPIEWLRGPDGRQGATWNPIVGCSVVSPGCTNCYAMRLAGTRMKSHPSRAGMTRDSKAGPVWTGDVRFQEQWLTQPLRWSKPRMIFVCAHADLFHEAVPDEWIDRVFAVMALSPQHTFQVLTKRPERMRAYIRDEEARGGALCRAVFGLTGRDPGDAPAWPLPNVWLGVSVEDQRRADERIPILLDTPAAVRWISAEPLLGPIDVVAFVRNRWGIKMIRRAWNTFIWPDWVPDSIRDQITSFWSERYGRGPSEWIKGARENGQPAIGTRGSFALPRNGHPLIQGRFVPAWNNIGRVVDDAGDVHCVVAGIYQSHPAGLDWVVAGGESGTGARPMHPDWARSLRDQCAAVGVPFLFKQWGEWAPSTEEEADDNPHSGWKCLAGHPHVARAEELYPQNGAAFVARVGKKAAGRLLDGVTHDGYPEAPR